MADEIAEEMKKSGYHPSTNVGGVAMDELYGWIAERHNFDKAQLRESARGWSRVGFTLMSVSGAALVFVLGLGSQPTGDLLDGVRRQIPGWLPLVAYVAFWIGVVASMYGWAIRRTVKRLSAYL